MVVLTACAYAPPAPVEDRSDDRRTLAPILPAPPAVEARNRAVKPPTETRTAAARAPATLALVRESEVALGVGNIDEAGARIDRAIRLYPEDPWVWHQLAQVRMAEAKWREADQIARRSNALAGADDAVIRANWLLIAEAARRVGDASAADEAESRAQSYR